MMKKTKYFILKISFLTIGILFSFILEAQVFNVQDYGIVNDGKSLNTTAIQKAIDDCAAKGGGTVYFPKATYLTGGIHLKSNVTLKFEKGAVWQGSDNCTDYGDCKWTDALISGNNLKNIKIIGAAIIDGVDCKNPKGEEGFRGPHGIRLVNCDGIEIRDITITRSGNWAQNFRHCTNGLVQNVKVRGGHDAFHTRWCKNFVVKDCDFRTGDDCFAGNDNHDFVIENCKANTSCNAFRFGCQNLTIRDCYIWGPGEYKHLSQNRNNTISAFTHFSPPGENPESKNGNWKVEHVTIEGVDNVFIYNFDFGLWQTGQPATDFVFENLTAKNVKKSFTIIGDTARQFQLTIRNSVLQENGDTHLKSAKIGGKETPMPAFFNSSCFKAIYMENVTIKTNGKTPPMIAEKGNVINLRNVKFISDGNMKKPVFKSIEKVVKN